MYNITYQVEGGKPRIVYVIEIIEESVKGKWVYAESYKYLYSELGGVKIGEEIKGSIKIHINDITREESTLIKEIFDD